MRKFIRNFRRNYKINIQALSAWQECFYRWCVRPFNSLEERNYFEGVPGIAGQLYRAERRALFEAIVDRAPSFVFEIGTFNGGGSTYFSAQALSRVGRGKLITLEIDPDLHAKAVELYATRFPKLREQVEFVLGSSPQLFEPFLQQAGSADFVFLDGAEHAEQSLDQLRFFEPWFRSGSVLAMHDWQTEKMRLVRDLILRTPKWREQMILREPDSIGFALFVRA